MTVHGLVNSRESLNQSRGPQNAVSGIISSHGQASRMHKEAFVATIGSATSCMLMCFVRKQEKRAQTWAKIWTLGELEKACDVEIGFISHSSCLGRHLAQRTINRVIMLVGKQLGSLKSFG
ncbi:hypothetical protein C0Q70_03428 [Pomacea canaliculata]|uniref:Uncharacterized protein n=1 Tax=Pomacea canaliculata TaxID=400727 RepID=A0A2T7PSQ7_POMCA|nr:hypothetical protein C0Q70_03428 [Pomacea canaliculata]